MAKFLIVEARFYDAINDQLLDGARTALEEAGHEHETITVPGCGARPRGKSDARRGTTINHSLDASYAQALTISITTPTRLAS